MNSNNQKVLVFKDIKNKRWTIWNEDKTIHLGYKKKLLLKKCIFVVNQKKRSQVIKSGSRFPHAWIIGELDGNFKLTGHFDKVTYNPFKDRFFKKNNKYKILKSSKVLFDECGKVWTK